MFPFFVSSAIVLWALYALLAAGFVLVYRTSRVLNLAYGALLLCLGYVGVTLQGVLRFPWLAAVAVLAVGAVLGWAVSAGVLRPFVGHPPFSSILATLAFGEVVSGLTVSTWQGRQAFFALPSVRWQVGSFTVWSTDLLTVLVALACLGGLLALDRYSRIGRQMRAVADDSLLAAQRGVKIHSVLAVAWVLAVSLAGVAGVLLGARQSLGPGLEHVGLKALPVAMVGGLDSLVGVVPAALLVALAETAVALYVDPLAGDAIPFAILLVVLLLRPWGMFGTREELERI